MIYYLIIVVLFLAYRLKRREYCIFATILLTCFAGLRSNVVGIDTSMYEYLYNDLKYANDLGALIKEYRQDSEHIELGYFLSEFFFQKIIPFECFKIIQSFAAIAPFSYFIYKRSYNPVVSFVLFFTLPLFVLVSMSAMRQGIAFGFTVLAIDSCIDRKLKKFLVMMSVAFLFHSSSLIILPLYLLNYVRYRRTNMVWILPILYLVFIMSTPIFYFLNSYSRIDYDVGAAGGERMLLFFFLIYGTTFLVDDDSANCNINKWLIYMLLYTIALWFVGMNLAAIFRLVVYTEVYIALFVPNVLANINKKYKKILTALIILGTISAMSTLVVRTGVNHYYPYYFLWER